MKQLVKKSIGLLLLFIILTYASNVSAVSVTSGEQYRIVNNYVGNGGMCLGRLHSSQSPFCYVGDEIDEDMFWTFTEEKPGEYSIRNAKTNDYLTFDSIYGTWRRYINTTQKMRGDSSLWTVTVVDGSFSINSVLVPLQHLNLRTNTMIMGTYYFASGYTSNSLFTFYDKNGEKLQDESVKRLNVLNYLDTLQFNGVRPIYDNRARQLMLPVTIKAKDEAYFMPVVQYGGKRDLTLYISSRRVIKGGQFNMGKLTGGRQYELVLRADTGIVASTKMTLTLMPVVEINGTGFGTNSYKDGTFRVTDADYSGSDSLYLAGFRYRGASNSQKQKKSYAIKLHDSNGISVDQKFHGLRKDNSWILDAMAIDVARMRNASNFDLWNKYAADCYYKKSEPKAMKASRCFFVEVILNGEYAGIYNMMEKSDREQFNLKKEIDGVNGAQDTVRGVLFKATSWSSSCLMTATGGDYSNSSETWDGWECQYPDLSDGESIDWATLYNAVKFVSTSSPTDFSNQLGNYFDLPVWRDFYLLVELGEAYDNIGKNLYVYAYNIQKDKKLCVAPWDTEGSWGREWSSAIGTRQSPTFDMTATNDPENGSFYKNGLFYRLRLWYPGWENMLADRYKQLRNTYFREDSLSEFFSKTFELYNLSGADAREVERWNGADGINLDFSWEKGYLMGWVHDRLAYLDKQYGYDPAGVASPTINNDLAISGEKGKLIVNVDRAQVLNIFDLTGKCLFRIQLEPGVNQIPLAPGFYVVGKKKVMVE